MQRPYDNSVTTAEAIQHVFELENTDVTVLSADAGTDTEKYCNWGHQKMFSVRAGTDTTVYISYNVEDSSGDETPRIPLTEDATLDMQADFLGRKSPWGRESLLLGDSKGPMLWIGPDSSFGGITGLSVRLGNNYGRRRSSCGSRTIFKYLVVKTDDGEWEIAPGHHGTIKLNSIEYEFFALYGGDTSETLIGGDKCTDINYGKSESWALFRK